MSNNTVSTVLIREMREADTVSVHDIHSECLLVSLLGHYTRREIDIWMEGRTPEGYWRSVQSGSTYLVAESEASIIGYANWDDDELMSLFVRPHIQHKGLGTALFNACDTRAELRCVKATLSAVGFYEKFGFRVDHHGHDMKRGIQIPHIFMTR